MKVCRVDTEYRKLGLSQSGAGYSVYRTWGAPLLFLRRGTVSINKLYVNILESMQVQKRGILTALMASTRESHMQMVNEPW